MESTPTTQGTPSAEELESHWNRVIGRRGFLMGVGSAGAAALAGGALGTAGAFADSGRLSRGDAAILRFLAAAEILETDLWQQYAGARRRERRQPRLHRRPARTSTRTCRSTSRTTPTTRRSHADIPERLPALEGRGAGEPGRVPHAPEQQGDRRPPGRPADEPAEAERRHELVHALPQHQEPGLRGHVPAGREHHERAGDPAERHGHPAGHVRSRCRRPPPSRGGCRPSPTRPGSTSP